MSITADPLSKPYMDISPKWVPMLKKEFKRSVDRSKYKWKEKLQMNELSMAVEHQVATKYNYNISSIIWSRSHEVTSLSSTDLRILIAWHAKGRQFHSSISGFQLNITWISLRQLSLLNPVGSHNRNIRFKHLNQPSMLKGFLLNTIRVRLIYSNKVWEWKKFVS